MTKDKDIPKDNLEAYNALIAQHSEIERKGKTMPYTSLNGHMFSHLSKEGVMGLRLPEEERARFLEEYQMDLFVQHNRVMKEYVTVPEQLLMDTKRLSHYLDISLAYIRTLKPKATTRKKKNT